jgi:hypothetical protein
MDGSNASGNRKGLLTTNSSNETHIFYRLETAHFAVTAGLVS